MPAKVEEAGEIPKTLAATGIRQLSVWVTQLVEERMAHGLDSRETLSGSILKQSRYQINSFRRSFAEYLVLRRKISSAR